MTATKEGFSIIWVSRRVRDAKKWIKGKFDTHGLLLSSGWDLDCPIPRRTFLLDLNNLTYQNGEI